MSCCLFPTSLCICIYFSSSFVLFKLQLENDLPDSVLAYFKASSNRMNSFEQLILEDLNDLGEVCFSGGEKGFLAAVKVLFKCMLFAETMCNEMFRPSQHAALLNELGSNFDEDPLKLKERVCHSLLFCCGLVVLEVDVTM